MPVLPGERKIWSIIKTSQNIMDMIGDKWTKHKKTQILSLLEEYQWMNKAYKIIIVRKYLTDTIMIITTYIYTFNTEK